MDTKVLLIRHGDTDWHEQGKLLGRRDRPLSNQGREQSERVTEALASMAIAEMMASPLQRAVQTAEHIGKRHNMDIARDSRLTDMNMGSWEGMSLVELRQIPEYRQYLDDPLTTPVPGGENFEQVKRRAVAAVTQIVEDSAGGDIVAVVTHGAIIRALLVHYLSAPPASFHRLRISAGSVSILAFSHDEVPRIEVMNWCPDLTATA